MPQFKIAQSIIYSIAFSKHYIFYCFWLDWRHFTGSDEIFPERQPIAVNDGSQPTGHENHRADRADQSAPAEPWLLHVIRRRSPGVHQQLACLAVAWLEGDGGPQRQSGGWAKSPVLLWGLDWRGRVPLLLQ